MVGLCGLEPQTSCVSSRRSNQSELQTRRDGILTHLLRCSHFLGVLCGELQRAGSGGITSAVRAGAPIVPGAPVLHEKRPIRHRVAAHAMLRRGLAVVEFFDLRCIEKKRLAVVAGFANEQATGHRWIIACLTTLGLPCFPRPR